jgi:hypothetical protein
MRVLELFKGTGSVGAYYKQRNGGRTTAQRADVTSLDIDPSTEPDFCVDILQWDYEVYPPGYFDVIWASPECKLYSQLQRLNIGRFISQEELTDQRILQSCVIRHVCRIIEYLKPRYYFIENPHKSLIWDYLPSDFKGYKLRVDYCRFGLEYKKPTVIFTNRSLEHCRCTCKSHRVYMGLNSKHLMSQHVVNPDRSSTKDRYVIPMRLLKYLLQ